MLLQGFKRGVYFFAKLLANFTNIVWLMIVYVTVLTATAVVAKIFRKKFLNYNQRQWIDFNQNKDKNLYFKQF